MMKTQGLPRLAVPLGIAIVLVALAWWGMAAASADAPTVIPYQGRLTDLSGRVINATLPMTFALYAVPEGGSAAWVEEHAAVTVEEGLFTAYLGEITSLSSGVLNDNAYLGLTVGSDSEMSPRQRLGSVPYARTLAPGASVQGGADFAATGTAIYATSVDGPAILADLWISGQGAHGFSHALVSQYHGVGAFAGVLGSGDDGPGVIGRSLNGTGVVGEAARSLGGPLWDPLDTLAETTRAGVMGYSPVGPGVFAWSTITHSLVVSGDAHVTGDLFLGGSVTPNADMAENYVASGTIEAGDVVVIDPETRFGVRHTNQPYDTRVAGIISTDPAIVLPGGIDGVPLALVGRVPVKVDASYAAVRVGDLLTSSPTPGHAMCCTDRLQCVGAIIGKALEPLESGTGVIQALVALQ
jgi:hypothetical protein